MNRVLASLCAAMTLLFVLVHDASAQAGGSGLKQKQRHKTYRGIDKGMVIKPPKIGDDKIAIEPPQRIDDGIFTSRRNFKTYERAAKPKAMK